MTPPGFLKSLHDFGIEGDPSPTRAFFKSIRDCMDSIRVNPLKA
jgi:hypothetical protein